MVPSVLLDRSNMSGRRTVGKVASPGAMLRGGATVSNRVRRNRSEVGFGDVAPSKALPRGLVIAEISISWLLLSLTFSTLTSWVVSHIQRAHNERIADEERKMKMRETALKEAGVGLHSDTDAMMKEARRRLEEKKAK